MDCHDILQKRDLLYADLKSAHHPPYAQICGNFLLPTLSGGVSLASLRDKLPYKIYHYDIDHDIFCVLDPVSGNNLVVGQRVDAHLKLC